MQRALAATQKTWMAFFYDHGPSPQPDDNRVAGERLALRAPVYKPIDHRRKLAIPSLGTMMDLLSPDHTESTYGGRYSQSTKIKDRVFRELLASSMRDRFCRVNIVGFK